MMQATLKTLIAEKSLEYTGKELRPHFLLEKFNLRGNAILAFEGACSVATDDLVDWEDRLNHDFIKAKKMLHFIGEFFGMGLTEGVFFQRLFMAHVFECLVLECDKKYQIKREGDDIFVSEKKLTVSIVTQSPVSCLMHVGININPEGAPVDAIGLDDFQIQSQDFAKKILACITNEWDSMQWACAKVKPVV